MARLFFPSSVKSATCMRCGNSMPDDAETCPHCGADHGGGSIVAGKTATFSNGLRLPLVARRGSLAAPSPYPSLPEEAELAGTGEHRWDNSKSITLAAVMLALIAGGVIYSQTGEREGTSTPTPTGHSAYGAIDMKAAQGASAPESAAANRFAAAPPAKPAAQTQTPAAAAPTVVAIPAATIDNLQATRDAMERGDLSTARRRFSRIPAAQLGAGNIQRTQSELASLEHTRDSLLQTARGCEATGSWICVRQNARDVLAIDASNVEAQTLVEHAITRSGWLNKTPPATAHAAPKSGGTTPLATATSPAFVAGQHPGAATASIPAPARKVVPPPAVQSRPIPVMPATVTTTTQPAPVASDSTRVSTGSHAPLASSRYVPASQPASLPSTSTFIPMPDGPEAATVRAVSPAAPAAVRTPSVDTATSRTANQPAPVTESTPVRAAVVQPSIPSTSAAPVRNTTDPDAEERAILESGWTKGQSQKPPSQSQ